MWNWLQRSWQQYQEGRRLRQLISQARHSQPVVRVQAAADLAGRPDEGSVRALIQLLEDIHPAVREVAQAGLRKMGPAAKDGLLVALNHGNAEVARFAAETLGELGSQEVVGPLITGLKFAQRPVQNACRRALVRLGPLAVPALQAVSNEPQPWVRQQILEILAGGAVEQQPNA
jgi:HEAT repeat protein